MTNIKFLSDDNEVIRIDAKGFHYRGQFIEDAGEAHRLLVEFLREHQPEGNWQHAQAEPQPVPVSERWPEFSDCDSAERVWCWSWAIGTWRLSRINQSIHSHWLPAHALPLLNND